MRKSASEISGQDVDRIVEIAEVYFPWGEKVRTFRHTETGIKTLMLLEKEMEHSPNFISFKSILCG